MSLIPTIRYFIFFERSESPPHSRCNNTTIMVRFIPYVVAAAYLVGTEAFAPAPSQIRTQRLANNNVVASQSQQLTSPTVLADMLTQTELPAKIYLPKDKESPKALGGLKVGSRKLTVITGASSGLGLNTAVALSKTGRHFVVMAVRDVEKGKKVAKELGMEDNTYVVMKLELGSLQSVRDFVFNLKAFKSARPLDNLICNAAVYRPTDPEPAWTDDGFEQSMGINHFGHFLLANLMVDDMAKAKDARMCIVGSITGNTNTVGEYESMKSVCVAHVLGENELEEMWTFCDGYKNDMCHFLGLLLLSFHSSFVVSRNSFPLL